MALVTLMPTSVTQTAPSTPRTLHAAYGCPRLVRNFGIDRRIAFEQDGGGTVIDRVADGANRLIEEQVLALAFTTNGELTVSPFCGLLTMTVGECGHCEKDEGQGSV